MMGCGGKWAIHPSQIEPINDAFRPSDAEIEAATEILEALELATREGRGAITIRGRMVDAASIRQAHQLLAKAAP